MGDTCALDATGHTPSTDCQAHLPDEKRESADKKGAQTMSRKVADCRDFPSENGCTLTISGEEDEVIVAAVQHAAAVHGHPDNDELRVWLKQNLRDEVAV